MIILKLCGKLDYIAWLLTTGVFQCLFVTKDKCNSFYTVPFQDCILLIAYILFKDFFFKSASLKIMLYYAFP